MHTSLDEALEGVARAAKQARQAQLAAEREAADSRAQAEEWQRRYRQERERILELRAQLREARAVGGSGGPCLPARTASRSSASFILRRNTVPPEHHRRWVSTDQQSGGSSGGEETAMLRPLPERSDSALSTQSLSTLSSTLAACLLLQGAVQSGGTGGSGSGAHLGHSDHEHDHDHDHTTVSVADDGTSGVGAAAAAAVSVALARSWAAVAGGGRSPALPADGSGTPGKRGDAGQTPAHRADTPSKARFKLVAAVPRNLARGGPIPGSKIRPTLSTAALTDAGTRAGGGSPPPGEQPPSPARQASIGMPALDPGLALESIDDARELDEPTEATWRASGSHLKLHWMSAPAAVGLVYKPAAEVVPAAAAAAAWLVSLGVTVFVEPEAHEEMRREALAVLWAREGQNGSAEGANGHTAAGSEPESPRSYATASDTLHRVDTTGSEVFGAAEPLEPGCEAQKAAEEGARAAAAAAAPDPTALVHRLLLSWEAPPSNCGSDALPLIPTEVAHRLDLVLTLGGDGTVLWACSLFGNGAVPPVVPISMGSLGFMTPFPVSRMESVLARVTSVAHGFPLMLRHRLQCRILRAGTSAGDLPALPAAPCASGDVLVLNEVVIDRGPTASLANLQCYVDANFVTTIQGDGLIVATPTGSTAYNLAAGGSMVHPAVPCILFTPICAHTLSSRPLVFPEHVTLRVKVPADSRGEAYCSFDGRGRHRLRPGDSVLIHVSQWPVPMVCNLDSSHDWFLSVREGLNWNRRVPQKPLG